VAFIRNYFFGLSHDGCKKLFHQQLRPDYLAELEMEEKEIGHLTPMSPPANTQSWDEFIGKGISLIIYSVSFASGSKLLQLLSPGSKIFHHYSKSWH
jgi:hypothetical protein